VLPADATFVGLLAAGAVGYRRGGLLVAWLAPLAAYLGFRADWALLGLSGHALPGRVAYLLDPVGIAVLAAGAVLVGTAGYAAGGLAGRAV
jgi:hypothetical protein